MKKVKKVVKAKVVEKVKEKAVVNKGKVVKVEDKNNRTIKPEVKQPVVTKFEDLSPPEQVIRVVKKLVDTIAGSGDLEKLAKDTLERAGLLIVKTAVGKSIPGNLEIPIMQRSQPSIELKYDGKEKLAWTIKTYADNVEECTKLALAEAEKLMQFEVSETTE